MHKREIKLSSFWEVVWKRLFFSLLVQEKAREITESNINNDVNESVLWKHDSLTADVLDEMLLKC